MRIRKTEACYRIPKLMKKVPDGMITAIDAAKLIGVSYNTLANWRYSDDFGPMYYKFGNSIYYDTNEIEKFIKEQKKSRITYKNSEKNVR